MAWQADHTYVVCEELSTKLCTQAQFFRCLLQSVFQFNVAESLSQLIAFGRQVVVIFGRRQLHCLQVSLCRRTADHKRQVVGRAGSRTQRLHLLNQEGFQFPGGKQSLGFLVEVGLIGGTTSLGNAKELVFITLHSIEIDLCRQVGASIHLVVHVEGSIL